MFQSFLMAGFDGTSGRNVHGQPINTRLATGHGRHLDADYAMLRDIGIATVRDGVPWPDVQTGPARFDWSAFDTMLQAAQRNGIEVLHDLCHFGIPDHLDIFSDRFVTGFAEFCFLAARRIAAATDGAIHITPLNEPSYYAWAAAHAAMFPPYCRNRAFDLKVVFARAILAGIDAITAAAPTARIITIDPVCRAVAPVGRPDLDEAVHRFNTVAVYEMWDLISGRLLPELGGTPAHLGTIGVNYYWTNQWEYGAEDVALADDDPRRAPLRQLIGDVWQRYGRDIILTETGHIGAMRATWIRELAHEVDAILDRGIPLQGVCLYPILGMPSWHQPDRWLDMGLWDVAPDGQRRVHAPMLAALSGLAR